MNPNICFTKNIIHESKLHLIYHPCFKDVCGVQKFNHATCPTKAEEANTAPRNPYTQIVRPERRAIATSMAHYRKGPHYRGGASESGLALT